jgi:hypothetical protein
VSVPLYTPGHVAIATFFGTPLGGAIVMALNERRLGRPNAAIATVLLGALASAVVVGIAVALPDDFPGAPLGIGSLLAMRYAAQLRHHEALTAHASTGGRKGSGWAAFGIGLACAVVVMIPVFCIAFAAAMVKGD